MAWTGWQFAILIIYVVTSTLLTLLAKGANRTKSVGSDEGPPKYFAHPWVQTLLMFIGEALCLLVFKLIYFSVGGRKENGEEDHPLIKGSQDFHPCIFFIPAILDLIATFLTLAGLILTYASSFQMMNGALIVFVALLSIVFLDRVVTLKMWIGILIVIIGLVLVGVTDMLLQTDKGEEDTEKNALIGDLIIAGAQIIHSSQMVFEENYVINRDISPLQAVGWEGIFGTIVLGMLMVPFYYLHVPRPFSDNTRGVVEDLPDALVQMMNNLILAILNVVLIICIGIFNFAAVTCTKELTAVTRIVFGSVFPIIFIYLFSLLFEWQIFHPLHIVAFGLLLIGLFIYNDLIPSVASCKRFFTRSQETAA